MTDEAIPLTRADVFGRLNQAVRAAGSQQAFATQCGVSRSFVNQVLNCEKPIPDSMLLRLGVKRVVTFVPVQR